MPRLRYTRHGGLGYVLLSFSLPDPATLDVPAVQEAASEFRRLEAAVAASWAALTEARAALAEAEAADAAARQDAIRAGRAVTKPRARTAPAQAVLADAEAVHADTEAVRDEAARRLKDVVVESREAIRHRVAEASAPIRERLAELAAEAKPLRRELVRLEEWTTLEHREGSGGDTVLERLGPPAGSAAAIAEATGGE